MTMFSRRQLLLGGAVLAVSGGGFMKASRTWAQAAQNPLPEVQALFFDVFGTVVDWRNGVAREVEKVLKPKGYTLDWLAVADAWRAEYQPGMDEVRTGRQPFAKLDIIHRRMLDKIKPRFGLEKLDEATQAELNLAWHRLDAWKDVGPGFARLRTPAAAVPLLQWQHRHHGGHWTPQRSALARHPGLGNRRRLQAQAARLSCFS